TSEYPPQCGGVSDYTANLARALAAAGEEVHVWCPPAGGRSDCPGITVHASLGRIFPGDLFRVSAELDAYPGPRRLLVQWVPHGYGWRSMNVPFCLWLNQRARRRGDCLELMVHEPFLAFREGSALQDAVAAVHRIMTVLLLSAAPRVWLSIPEWESR